VERIYIPNANSSVIVFQCSFRTDPLSRLLIIRISRTWNQPCEIELMTLVGDEAGFKRIRVIATRSWWQALEVAHRVPGGD
jgi:hypothetical protein